MPKCVVLSYRFYNLTSDPLYFGMYCLECIITDAFTLELCLSGLYHLLLF